MHKAEPECLEESWSCVVGRWRDTGQVDEQRARQDQRQEDQGEPADQGDGAFRDGVIEPVSQPVGERNLSRTSLHGTPGQTLEEELYRPSGAWPRGGRVVQGLLRYYTLSATRNHPLGDAQANGHAQDVTCRFVLGL